MLTALDHVQVAMPAGGEESARDFYCGLLGLDELQKPAALAARGGAWFRGATGGDSTAGTRSGTASRSSAGRVTSRVTQRGDPAG